MNLLTRILSSFGILFLISPLVLYLFLREPAPKLAVTVADFYMQDINYSHWGKAQGKVYKDFTMTAKKLYLQDKEFGPFTIALLKELVLDHPQIMFYREGINYAQLNAGQALPDTKVMAGQTDFMGNRTITFKQNPMLANIQGRVFTCNAMVWDKAENTFRGEGACQLQLGNEIVQAPVMIVDPNLNAWHVPGVVS